MHHLSHDLLAERATCAAVTHKLMQFSVRTERAPIR